MQEINNFIKTIMENDLKEGRVTHIVTRFPPEPTAYLHLGHARAIITDFELADAFGGETNLRFDDTNPAKEEAEYVEAIKEDIKWLGYEPERICYGSDYFDETYQRAIILIKKGLAYVDDQSAEEISKTRGTLTEGGIESPYRKRSVEENLTLFERMKKGEFKNGEKVLRAKIDMASPNINMRDPVLYRILHAAHHHTGDKWCIYPMYDIAHPLQDSIEGVTHSLCSIEFENHRPLYDWCIKECEMPHVSHQIEFGRLNITHAIMSKRYLKELVDQHKVVGFDDPRLPTLRGLKRRGYTPESIREFILDTGLSRMNSTTPYEKLDFFLREDLKFKISRPNAVINPLKVVITNYPAGQIEYLDAPNNSEDEKAGTRKIAFSRNVYIDQDDFIEVMPNRKWKRLAKDVEVRLMHAYFIKCHEVIKDEKGKILELHCTYDEQTKSGSGFEGRKPNGNIHFVEASTAIPATFNLFTPLLLEESEESKNKSFLDRIDPNSWIVKHGYVEESLKNSQVLDKFQFVRTGYFCVDQDSKPNQLVFNRICELRSSFTF